MLLGASTAGIYILIVKHSESVPRQIERSNAEMALCSDVVKKALQLYTGSASYYHVHQLQGIYILIVKHGASVPRQIESCMAKMILHSDVVRNVLQFILL